MCESETSQSSNSDQIISTKRQVWLSRYVVGLLIAFIGFTLGPMLFGLRTFLGVGILNKFWPWVANGPHTIGQAIFYGDTIDSVIPGIAYFRRQIFSGHLPSWQGLVAGGSPLGSVPDLGMLDPLSLPYWLLPLWLAPAFVALLVLATSIFGTYGFLRLHGASKASSLIAGFVYATSGFMVLWSNWPQVRTAALIPVILWSVERLIRKQRITDAVIVALVIVSALFGGFPQATGFGLYLVGLYLIVRVVIKYRRRIRDAWRPIWLSMLGLLLGVGFSLVQLLPFISQLQTIDLTYRQGNFFGIHFSTLITTGVPDAIAICSQTAGVSCAPVEVISYIGVAALLLAILGATGGWYSYSYRYRSSVRIVSGFFFIAVFAIIAIGWGPNWVRHIVDHLPVFGGNPIGRVNVIFGLSFSILAGLGYDVLVRRDSIILQNINNKNMSYIANQNEHVHDAHEIVRLNKTVTKKYDWCNNIWKIIVPICFTVLTGAVLLRAKRAADYKHNIPVLIQKSTTPAMFAVVVVIAVVLIFIARWHWIRFIALLIVPTIIMIQGADFYHTMQPGSSKENFYPVTGTHEFLAANLGADRYAASGGVMYTQTSLYYNLRTPTGHVFTAIPWSDLLQAIDPGVMISATNSNFSGTLKAETIGNNPILDRMGVKYFVTSPGDLPGEHVPVPKGAASVVIPQGKSTVCTITGGPIRGISYTLTKPLAPVNKSGGLLFTLAIQDGARRIDSSRYVPGGLPANSTVSIAVPGEALPAGGKISAAISVTGAVAGSKLQLAAVGAEPTCAPVLPKNDGLKLVYADAGSIIYQRLTALPRIRWAPKSTVITPPATQVLALSQGEPVDTVVLSEVGQAGSGKPAQVQIGADSGDTVAAQVTAAGGGYLVVADSLQQPGWSATVDGKSAPLVAADHAMGAVYVPAGRHQVILHYIAPGQRVGALGSLATAVIAGLLLFWDRRSRRRGAHSK